MVVKEAKKRREAATAYTDAGRPELADKEMAELAVLEAYLPAQLSDDELTPSWPRPCVHRRDGMAPDGPGHEGRAAGGRRTRGGRAGGRSRAQGPGRRARATSVRRDNESAPRRSGRSSFLCWAVNRVRAWAWPSARGPAWSCRPSSSWSVTGASGRRGRRRRRCGPRHYFGVSGFFGAGGGAGRRRGERARTRPTGSA